MSREKAESLLVYYIRTAWEHTDLNWTGDNDTEVRLIVDNLMDAVRDEVRAESAHGERRH